jgi:hypothetical protein
MDLLGLPLHIPVVEVPATGTVKVEAITIGPQVILPSLTNLIQVEADKVAIVVEVAEVMPIGAQPLPQIIDTAGWRCSPFDSLLSSHQNYLLMEKTTTF